MNFKVAFPAALTLLIGSVPLPAGAQTAANDETTTTPPPPPYGIGVVEVRDHRILDLSGDYSLENTTASLAFHLVQDGRGKLIGNYTVTHETRDGGTVTTGPFPLAGHLAVAPGMPLTFEAFGRQAPSGRTTDTQTALQDHETSRTGTPLVYALRLKGVQRGENFRTEALITTPRGPAVLRGPIVPDNESRGLVIGDAQTRRPRPGNLLSTRTVTLPWGTRYLPANERTRRRSTRFDLGASPKSRIEQLAPAPGLGMNLHGVARPSGEFLVHLNHFRLGYGHMDVTTSTVVNKTTFPLPE